MTDSVVLSIQFTEILIMLKVWLYTAFIAYFYKYVIEVLLMDSWNLHGFCLTRPRVRH